MVSKVPSLFLVVNAAVMIKLLGSQKRNKNNLRNDRSYDDQ